MPKRQDIGIWALKTAGKTWESDWKINVQCLYFELFILSYLFWIIYFELFILRYLFWVFLFWVIYFNLFILSYLFSPVITTVHFDCLLLSNYSLPVIFLAKLRHLSYCEKSFRIPCCYHCVSFVISHRVNNISTMRSSLNLSYWDDASSCVFCCRCVFIIVSHT